MSNRFDLEQQILECWKITDDIRTVLEHSDTQDMKENFQALAKFTDIRFEKLWYIFETMIEKREFSDMASITPAVNSDNSD